MGPLGIFKTILVQFYLWELDFCAVCLGGLVLFEITVFARDLF